MKRARSQWVRKARRYWPEPTEFELEGFPGQRLLCSGFVFRCPACCAGESAGACATCAGTGDLALNDPRIYRVLVAAPQGCAA